MEEIQKQIANIVSELMPQLCALSDEIFDYAEPGYEEYRSSAALTKWLRAHDFEVTIPYAGLDTAFCAVYRHKGGRAAGGRAVGFLGEYDALRGQGHGCAHHMQTPAMIGAAMALRGVLESSDQPFEIHVIGTPSEESLDGGKNEMAAHGGFDHIDVAFMVHGSTLTQLETPSLALIEMDVEFHGKTAHAGIAPYAGRSAVDAVTMLQTGLGLMRNHLKDSSRVSNIVLAGGTAVNSVPDFAKVKVEIRHSSMAYLESVEQWTREIAQAAAMATQTQVQITPVAHIYNTTINDAMGALLMECAEKFACDGIAPPRKDCGSTDFGAAEMVELDYVNDDRYAETRAHGLLMARKSRRAAAQNLRQKGLNSQQIEQALETVYAPDENGESPELEAAAALVASRYRKKLADGRRDLVVAALQRRGFAYAVIKEAIRRTEEEL